MITLENWLDIYGHLIATEIIIRLPENERESKWEELDEILIRAKSYFWEQHKIIVEE